jgi:hypothetical protein
VWVTKSAWKKEAAKSIEKATTAKVFVRGFPIFFMAFPPVREFTL